MGMIFLEYALVDPLSGMENVLSGQLGFVGFWRSFLRRFPQSGVDVAFRLLDRVGLRVAARIQQCLYARERACNHGNCVDTVGSDS